jgi:hypothetical protein
MRVSARQPARIVLLNMSARSRSPRRSHSPTQASWKVARSLLVHPTNNIAWVPDQYHAFDAELSDFTLMMRCDA